MVCDVKNTQHYMDSGTTAVTSYSPSPFCHGRRRDGSRGTFPF